MNRLFDAETNIDRSSIIHHSNLFIISQHIHYPGQTASQHPAHKPGKYDFDISENIKKTHRLKMLQKELWFDLFSLN